MIAFPIAASMAPQAHALRPMRIGANDEAVHYEARTFGPSPFGGCELIVRRMECFGLIAKPADGALQGEWFLDVLDAQGDILDTYEVRPGGVAHMRRVLGLKAES